MKNYFLLIILFTTNLYAKEVSIEIAKIKKGKGKVFVQIDTDAKSFKTDSEKDAYYLGIFTADSKKIFFTVNVPDKKKFAVSVFHDENNNQNLDTNLVGLPKEGIGLSNIRRIVKAYDFHEVATDGSKVLIEMNY